MRVGMAGNGYAGSAGVNKYQGGSGGRFTETD